MMRLLVVAFFLLGTTSAACAQNSVPASTDTNQNAAVDFAKTSAANPGSSLIVGASSVTPPAFGNFINSSSFLEAGAPLTLNAPAASAFPASSSTADPALAPTPVPRYLHGERDDFRWQLGVGIALVRLRTPVFLATAIGVNTTLSYFTNDWFGLEASLTGAFAPEINDREHVKYLGYGGGPRIVWRQKRWEPFAHAIFGGTHVLPQTALGSQNGFEIEAGGGTDYRFNPRLSARAEVDWLRTFLYGGSQNSAQAVLGLVAHF
ncbi:MAG TPA: hypothetical protein VGI16_15490 [Candidatus Acidoferrum sp.]|jgi:opacity protein-like surface antigen